MPDARLAQVMASARRKKDLGVRPGRLTEIAIRVAVITASANGDPEVTERPPRGAEVRGVADEGPCLLRPRCQ